MGKHLALDSFTVETRYVVLILDIQPVFDRCSEEPGQSEGGVGSDRSLSVHDKTDAVGGHAHCLSYPIDADAFAVHVFLEDFAGMNGM
jgi:hypothetical protein